MEISEFRERVRDYVMGDQASLDDEEWWGQVTDLSLLVLAERTRVKRAQRAAQSCPARYRGVTQCALLPNHRGDHFSPSTGRWKNDTPMHDAGEYRDPNTGEPSSPHVRDWGVAWFGRNGESGVCGRCQRARRVYQGYNGGAHIGKFCSECQRPVLRNEA